MSGPVLESMQAYAMKECCRGGSCPVCNPGPDPEGPFTCGYCQEAEVPEEGDVCEACKKDLVECYGPEWWRRK